MTKIYGRRFQLRQVLVDGTSSSNLDKDQKQKKKTESSSKQSDDHAQGSLR